jgi:tetratricopeptide (TPR) repeat protein
VLDATATCERINEFHIETEIAASFLDKTASYLSAKASYSSSFPMYQIGLNTRTKVFDVLGWSSTDNTIENTHDVQRTAQSKDIYNTQTLQSSKGILNIWKKALKAGHPIFANNLNDTNYLDNAKGSYTQVLSLYLRALAIKEKVLGVEHPSTALSLNNLAVVYCEQRDYVRALPLYERALDIFRKDLGEQHPNYKRIYENYVQLIEDMSKLSSSKC